MIANIFNPLKKMFNVKIEGFFSFQILKGRPDAVQVDGSAITERMTSGRVKCAYIKNTSRKGAITFKVKAIFSKCFKVTFQSLILSL